MPGMSERRRLAERLMADVEWVGCKCDHCALLRKAAEWLRRGCETCRYQAPAGQWIAEPCCARVSIPGHPVAIVTCASLGNGCHAWEGRARS